MKDQILVDTDVVVQYLKSGKGLLPSVYEKYEMVLSSISVAELLASKTFEDNSLLNEVMEFVDKYFTIKDVSKEIATKAADYIRINKVNLATATIAATAVTSNIPLLSENPKDFESIGEVSIHKE